MESHFPSRPKLSTLVARSVCLLRGDLCTSFASALSAPIPAVFTWAACYKRINHQNSGHTVSVATVCHQVATVSSSHFCWCSVLAVLWAQVSRREEDMSLCRRMSISWTLLIVLGPGPGSSRSMRSIFLQRSGRHTHTEHVRGRCYQDERWTRQRSCIPVVRGRSVLGRQCILYSRCLLDGRRPRVWLLRSP